jgi:hypothetical protein
MMKRRIRMKRMKKIKLLVIDEAKEMKQTVVIVSMMMIDMQDINY